MSLVHRPASTGPTNFWLPFCCVALLLASCSGKKQQLVEDLTGRENLSHFTLFSMGGTRDGDHLAAQAMISDSSSNLTLELHFKVGVPTTFESGTWKWLRNNVLSAGSVTASSVTFLGGQSGWPSVGGTFDLLDSGGSPHYRVNIPVTELKTRFRLPRSSPG